MTLLTWSLDKASTRASGKQIGQSYSNMSGKETLDFKISEKTAHN